MSRIFPGKKKPHLGAGTTRWGFRWSEQPIQEKIGHRSKIPARSTPDQYRAAGMSASPFFGEIDSRIRQAGSAGPPIISRWPRSWKDSARFPGNGKLFSWLKALVSQGFQDNPPKKSKKVFYKKRFSVNLQMSAAVKPRRSNQKI